VKSFGADIVETTGKVCNYFASRKQKATLLQNNVNFLLSLCQNSQSFLKSQREFFFQVGMANCSKSNKDLAPSIFTHSFVSNYARQSFQECGFSQSDHESFVALSQTHAQF